MALNLVVNEQKELTPRITVFGVGGAGGNAVNNMIDKSLEGVEFVVANTDAQALQQSRARARIQMGVKVTEGLGAGARPSVGSAAAEETIEEIIDHLAGSHMCFITAGMGGGTGTGAAPIIAQAARELGVLTVGVVTKPFQFEGAKRMRQAEEGVEALQKVVDTLIIIPNQNLFRLANEKTTFTEAFAMADDVLYQGVKGVTDLMVRPGLINLDFADVRAVMDEMGKAMMGTGEASGEDRAIQAAEKAIANPLLDEISLNGAKGVLINITGGHDLTLFELDEAANRIRGQVDAEANIIVGSTLDPEMEGSIRVSVVATGIDAEVAANEVPVPRRRMAEPLQPMMLEHPEHEQEPAAAHEPEPAYHQPAAQQPSYHAETQGGYQHYAPRNEPPVQEPAEPSLFADYPEERAEAQTHQARFELDDVLGDVPPSPHAARPAASQQYAPPPRPSFEDEVSGFVAPRPRTPGTPSPEALARLQAAVSKVPSRQGGPAPSRGDQPAEKPRFGINSLINRMTGQAADGAQAARRQPPMTGYDDEPEHDPDRDRIEIPAFLRRQAN